MRDGRARRKVLRSLVDPDTAPAKWGFAVVADVWTWNIDVQEMQFMYNNLHLPNTAADVEQVMRQQVGTDDEGEINRRLEALVAQQEDVAAGEIALAVQRRRDAMRRAARARRGLPQVANGKEGVGPEVIARIEAEIEASINQSDVGITVYKDPVTGKTTYHSDFTKLKATSSLKMNILGSKQQRQQAEEEEEEEEEGHPVPAPQPKLMASPSMRIAGLAARVASRRRGTNGDASFLPSLKRSTNEDAAFLPPLKRSMVEGLPKVGWCQLKPLL